MYFTFLIIILKNKQKKKPQQLLWIYKVNVRHK